MASYNLDPSNYVDRMRILTGDYVLDEPFLEDSVYVYLYQKNGNSELDGAIEALESIINNIALSPSRWTIGEATEWSASIPQLTLRLEELKLKRKGTIVPVVLHTDRSNWDDFNDLFN